MLVPASVFVEDPLSAALTVPTSSNTTPTLQHHVTSAGPILQKIRSSSVRSAVAIYQCCHTVLPASHHCLCCEDCLCRLCQDIWCGVSGSCLKMPKTWQESFCKLPPNSKMVLDPAHTRWCYSVAQVLMASLWNECTVEERGLTMGRLGGLLRVTRSHYY